MNVTKVGSFIRSQRILARLSLRNMSGLAGVSIPYLSQIERGLRKPSADILQSIARALRISAETLYVEAGMLEERGSPDVIAAVMADGTITERHQQALIEIYRAFRQEAAAQGAEPAAPRRRGSSSTSRAPSPKKKPEAASGTSARTTSSAPAKRAVAVRLDGRAEARAHRRPPSPSSALPSPMQRREV